MSNENHKNILILARSWGDEDRPSFFYDCSIEDAIEQTKKELLEMNPDKEIFISGVFTSPAPITDHGYR